MRFIRSLMLVVGAAIAAAGCAEQPVAYVAYPTASTAPSMNNTAYGAAAPRAPATMAGGTYAAAPSANAPYAAAPYAPAPYAAAPYATAPYGTAAYGTTPYGTTAYRTAPYAAAPYGTTGTVPSAAPRYAAAPYGTTETVPSAPHATTPYPSTAYRTAPDPAPRYAAAASGAAAYETTPHTTAGLYGYAPPATTAAEGPYTLDAGDRLRIVVFGQDGLTNSYLVSASGHIDMPLIGSVVARGATTDQLASRITEKLRNGYIREPHVAVEIEAYRPFFILGEVTAPGQYPYVANMTAETAVAIAGGFTPRAFRKNVILNRSYYGRPVRMAVPLAFPLRPGDTINVQERWF